MLIATSDDVNIPVFKIIMGRKGSSPLRYWLQVLDLVGQEMELENICDWLEAAEIVVIHIS